MDTGKNVLQKNDEKINCFRLFLHKTSKKSKILLFGPNYQIRRYFFERNKLYLELHSQEDEQSLVIDHVEEPKNLITNKNNPKNEHVLLKNTEGAILINIIDMLANSHWTGQVLAGIKNMFQESYYIKWKSILRW